MNQVPNTTNNINNNINDLFESMSYGQAYSFDIWITIIVILIVIFIAIYLFIINTITSQKANWEANKCNPFMMPFASMINSSNDPNYSRDNLNNCLNGFNKSITDDIGTPISGIFGIFSVIFQIAATIANTIMSYILYLINLIITLFLQLIERIKYIIQENSNVYRAINNMIGHILGFIAVLYYQIVLVVDSIKLMIPIFAMSFLITLVLPATIFTVISFILLFVFLVIGQLFSPIFCLGCWAWPLVAMWAIAGVIALAFTIFVYILYFKMMEFGEDILIQTLPISNTEPPESDPVPINPTFANNV